jgi:hypothetical protein
MNNNNHICPICGCIIKDTDEFVKVKVLPVDGDLYKNAHKKCKGKLLKIHKK